MKSEDPRMGAPPKGTFAALAAAGAAAILASACCVAPLALVLAGVSGAWIGQLSALGPYQPLFLVAAALALFFAWQRIWRAPSCDDGRACAAPQAQRAQKTLFVSVCGLLVVVLGAPVIAPYFY